jgi:flagellar basal body-associated protein FliL
MDSISILLIIMAVIIVLGGMYYFFFKSRENTNPDFKDKKSSSSELRRSLERNRQIAYGLDGHRSELEKERNKLWQDVNNNGI